jgi:heat shock protein HtpX
MNNIYQQVDQNKFKSNLVVASFIGFVALAAYAMAYTFDLGLGFVGYALIFGGLGSLISYYFSDKIILGISGAKAANRDEHFDLFTVTENLCLSAQLPPPKVYVIEDSAMNAFATGRDPQHAVVCATTGLLQRLDRTELEGVIAHELSHIKNYDMRLMSMVAVLVGMLTLVADWLLRFSMVSDNRDRKDSGQFGLIMAALGIILALLSPIIANLIKLAISRRREFLADASAAQLTRFPEGLARALEKISQDHEPLEAANKATAHLYIANPLKNHHDSIGWFANLFSTHPPVEQRIAALRS